MELSRDDTEYIRELTGGGQPEVYADMGYVSTMSNMVLDDNGETVERFSQLDGFSFTRLIDDESDEKIGWSDVSSMRKNYRRYDTARHADHDQHGITGIDKTARTDHAYNESRKLLLDNMHCLARLSSTQRRRVGMYYGLAEPRFTVDEIAKRENVVKFAVHKSIKQARRILSGLIGQAVVGGGCKVVA